MNLRQRGALVERVRRQAILVVVLYVVFAGLWIALSDTLLGVLVSDPEVLVDLSVFKGLFFVFATAGLLGLLLRRTVRTIELAADEANREEVARLDRETELERTRAAVAREEEFSAGVIDALPGVFYLLDQDGRFLRCNDNFSVVTGYSGDELVSMHPLDFFRDTDQPLLKDRIAKVFRDGDTSVEADFVSKDGVAHPYFFTGRRIELDGRSCLPGRRRRRHLRAQARRDGLARAQ